MKPKKTRKRPRKPKLPTIGDKRIWHLDIDAFEKDLLKDNPEVNK